MNAEQETTLVKSFSFEGKEQPVSFVETIHVADGVDCDVYAFVGDLSKDLGIIRISQGSKTPLQKIIGGERTVEGCVSGKGKLTIIKPDGEQVVYLEPATVDVEIGELMQWEADKESELKAYEICFPPYEDGRYENLK